MGKTIMSTGGRSRVRTFECSFLLCTPCHELLRDLAVSIENQRWEHPIRIIRYALVPHY
jgi:hypothetical protein